jgi:anti-anti-sigma factor
MSTSPARISVSQHAPGMTLVELRGEHDHAVADALAMTLTSALDRAPAMIIDLSDALFIDSSIVGELLREHNGTVVAIVSPPGGQPRRVLDMVEAATIVPVYDSRAAAAEALQSHAG